MASVLVKQTYIIFLKNSWHTYAGLEMGLCEIVKVENFRIPLFYFDFALRRAGRFQSSYESQLPTAGSFHDPNDFVPP